MQAEPVDGHGRKCSVNRPSLSTGVQLPAIRNQQVLGSSPSAGSKLSR